MLKVERLTAGYGSLTVLRDISLTVGEREIVVILGANGAGKSTLLRAISGLLPAREGRIELFGKSTAGSPPHRLVEAGMVHVPEGRGIFTELTVRENLELGSFSWARGRQSKLAGDLRRVFELFPALEERSDQSGGTLSGGQQQMLSIGRALMARPKLLLLDEPSLGLAPLVVKTILEKIARLRELGMGILLVEQNAHAALSLGDRGYVLNMGTVVAEGSAQALLSDVRVQRSYLGSLD
jgi:branched-chain amino acid transport system ATP-binding protein